MLDNYADDNLDYDPDPIYLDDKEDDLAEKKSRSKGKGRGKTKDKESVADDFAMGGNLFAMATPQKNPVRTFIGSGTDGEGVEISVDDEKQWYVIHCYSGYENKVMRSIQQRIDTMGMQDKIFDVIVPTEEEVEVKEGKRKTIERRVFPGYILVQMKMDEDSWYVVRNTPGVTGFVGMGNEPTPLRPEEVTAIIKRMEEPKPVVKFTFKPGQKVRIIDGPFNDFTGTVGDIDMEKGKVRVMVSFFGRETPVELDFLQVEKA